MKLAQKFFFFFLFSPESKLLNLWCWWLAWCSVFLQIHHVVLIDQWQRLLVWTVCAYIVLHWNFMWQYLHTLHNIPASSYFFFIVSEEDSLQCHEPIFPSSYPLSDKVFCETELPIQHCYMTFILHIKHLTVLLSLFYIKEMEAFQNSSHSQFQETCE